MASLATLQAYTDAAATALNDGDYGTAITKARAGLAACAGLVDGAVGTAQQSYTNCRESLKATLEEARRMRREAGAGVTRRGIRYKRASGEVL